VRFGSWSRSVGDSICGTGVVLPEYPTSNSLSDAVKPCIGDRTELSDKEFGLCHCESSDAYHTCFLEPRGCEVRRLLADQLIKLGHGLISLTRYHCYEPIVMDTRKLGDEQYRAQFGTAVIRIGKAKQCELSWLHVQRALTSSKL